jgi:hypothetical protein
MARKYLFTTGGFTKRFKKNRKEKKLLVFFLKQVKTNFKFVSSCFSRIGDELPLFKTAERNSLFPQKIARSQICWDQASWRSGDRTKTMIWEQLIQNCVATLFGAPQFV